MEPEELDFHRRIWQSSSTWWMQGTINGTVAKEVFEEIFTDDVDPETYVEEKGLKTVNDEGALRATIEEIVAANPQSVEDYHNGKEKAHGLPGGPDHEGHEGQSKSRHDQPDFKRIAVEKNFCCLTPVLC